MTPMPDTYALLQRAANLYQTEKVSESIGVCNSILERDARCVPALRILALCRTKMGLYDEAGMVFTRAKKLAPSNPSILADEAVMHRGIGQYKQMIACCRAALKIDPKHTIAQGMLADAFERSGDLEKAQEFIERTIKSRGLDAGLGETYAIVKELQGERDQAITILDRVLDSADGSDAVRRRLFLHRGRVLEKLGRYDEAFASFKTGNELIEATYNRREMEERFEQLAVAFEPWPMGDDVTEASESVLGVWIASMPRSGTSLVERILGAHSSVHGIGEIPVLRQSLAEHRDLFPHPIWESLGKGSTASLDVVRSEITSRLRACSGRRERIVSKNLTNARMIGVIGRLFPKAKVISLNRDSADIALSIWANTFALEPMPWSARLEDIGHFMRIHDQLVARLRAVVPNPWLEVNYADLAKNPEPSIRELIGFIDLDWEETCLKPEKVEADTRGGRFEPTLSYQQVRKPINTGSLGRAAKYGAMLDPLRDGLAGLR